MEAIRVIESFTSARRTGRSRFCQVESKKKGSPICTRRLHPTQTMKVAASRDGSYARVGVSTEQPARGYDPRLANRRMAPGPFVGQRRGSGAMNPTSESDPFQDRMKL